MAEFLLLFYRISHTYNITT